MSRSVSWGIAWVVALLGCSSSVEPDAIHDASALPDARLVDDAGDASPPVELRFRKITLHRDFVCEGAAIGDLDGDGDADVIAGPAWYEGPDFEVQHALWSGGVFEVNRYSDCFFQWARDVDGDGALDVIVVGFPGQAASWLQNPGTLDGEWQRHMIADVVGTESPELLDLVGDAAPELLFATAEGELAYAQPVSDPRAPWALHAITDERGFAAFTHGLGSADVDGDGRNDVIEATAYWLQPESLAGDPVWTRHAHAFGVGGGQILGDDADGDGDTDLMTTLNAHGYGLSWFEQQAGGVFVERSIVSTEVPDAQSEVIAHEPHALAQVDLDGDGLLDLVTGERHWGHVPEGEPDFDAPARLYWFRLVRDAEGTRYVPQLLDDDSGIGTQITTGDVNGDDRADIVIANKKGAFVFVQE